MRKSLRRPVLAPFFAEHPLRRALIAGEADALEFPHVAEAWLAVAELPDDTVMPVPWFARGMPAQ
jgi:hypothetical protein